MPPSCGILLLQILDVSPCWLGTSFFDNFHQRENLAFFPRVPPASLDVEKSLNTAFVVLTGPLCLGTVLANPLLRFTANDYENPHCR